MPIFISSVFLIGSLIFTMIYTDGPAREYFKTSVYSVQIDEDKPLLKNVPTTNTPVVTSFTVSDTAKNLAVKIESISISNTEGWLDSMEVWFESEYFKTKSVDLRVKADELRKKDVRVVEFFVVGDPVFLGSEYPNSWTYYLEGKYKWKGLFSSDSRGTFGNVDIFITLQQEVGEDGNPLGLKVTRFID